MHKRLSFRGTEFIFPEEIRKGILPVGSSRPPVLLLNCQARAPPIIPRDFPETIYQERGMGNGAEIYPGKGRQTLIWYRRVNNLRSSEKSTYENKRPLRAKRRIPLRYIALLRAGRSRIWRFVLWPVEWAIRITAWK